jgi:RND family efflux transporter MFP subunit
MVAQYASNVAVFKNDAVTKYQKARNAYDATFLKYRSLSRTSDAQTIEELIVATYDTTKIIADAVKSTNDFLGFVNDKITLRNLSVPAILTTHQNSLASYTSTTKSHLSSLLNIKDTITTSKYSIAEKKESLADLKAGSDAIDIKSAQLSLSQRQNALLDAQNTLADYYVRAPFAGTIAALSAKKYETAGSGTAIATLITSQQVAELSLNEVDAAKISLGDKASLTFDAIDGLTLTGQVVQIDTIGTVSQGVVSYAVKIGFDTQDERIKSGMTVNAAIQTDVRQDTLLVSSSAVKTQNGESYVQVFSPALSTTGGAQGVVSSVLPTQVPVTLGISDDTNVEVLSGVEEGAQVVVRTIFGTATTKPTTTGTTRSTGIGAPGGIRL